MSEETKRKDWIDLGTNLFFGTDGASELYRLMLSMRINFSGLLTCKENSTNSTAYIWDLSGQGYGHRQQRCTIWME